MKQDKAKNNKRKINDKKNKKVKKNNEKKSFLSIKNINVDSTKTLLNKIFDKLKTIKIDKRVLLVLMTMFTLSILAVNLKVYDIKKLTETNELAKFYQKFSSCINGYGIVYIPLFAGIYYFYSKFYFDGKKINWWVCALSIFMAFFTVLGYSYDAYQSWDAIFLNRFQFVKALFVILGYYFLFYICLKKLFQYAENYKEKESKNKILNFIFEKYSFIVPMVLIILCWSPYLFNFYPCITTSDTIRQVYEHYGLIGPTGHPWFHTAFLGLFTDFGDLVGNRNFGLFLFIAVQVCILAAIFSYTLHVMKEYKIPMFVRITSLLLYCFNGFFVLFSICAIKDSYFSAFYVLYIVLLFKGCVDENIFKSKKYCISLMVVILLIMLFRLDGMYRLLISFPFLILACRKIWKKLIIIILIPLCLYQGYMRIIIPNFVYTEDNVPYSFLAKYTPLFQQIGRVVKEHGTDAFSEKDTVILRKIYLRYDYLPKEYNPVKADPILFNMNSEITKEDFAEFMRVWLKYFPKYHQDYLQAFLNNTYGYFYPNRNNEIAYFAFADNWKSYDEKEIKLGYIEDRSEQRINLEKIQRIIKRIPVIGMSYSVGMYICVLLIITIYALSNKNKKLFALVAPGLAVLFVCLLGPENGHRRYMLPITFSTPFLISAFFYYGKNAIKNKKRGE